MSMSGLGDYKLPLKKAVGVRAMWIVSDYMTEQMKQDGDSHKKA